MSEFKLDQRQLQEPVKASASFRLWCLAKALLLTKVAKVSDERVTEESGLIYGSTNRAGRRGLWKKLQAERRKKRLLTVQHEANGRRKLTGGTI